MPEVMSLLAFVMVRQGVCMVAVAVARVVHHPLPQQEEVVLVQMVQ
jgi:hypothetical protein